MIHSAGDERCSGINRLKLLQDFSAMRTTSVIAYDLMDQFQDHDVRAIDRASGIVLGWHERDLADREFNLRRHVRRFKKLAPFWVMT